VRLVRIDHVGVVVPTFAEPAALLEALGLELGRTNENDESLAHYYPCGDASIELIEVHDPEARARRLPEGAQAVIEHIAVEVDDLAAVRDLLASRGVNVSWPPFPSGEAMMIWTDAATSGGVQYQFLVRPHPPEAG
jgi:catechol 2,3-dioxygenase-like lactoylglutathione lyase family enzyme